MKKAEESMAVAISRHPVPSTDTGLDQGTTSREVAAQVRED